MPTYTLRNKKTLEVFEHQMKMSEYDTFMKANPDVERHHIDLVAFGDPVRLGFKKPDAAFRDLLREKQKKIHGNKIESSTS